jgi:hypothetical protein
MSGLDHEIIYRNNMNLIEMEWNHIKFNPLSINGKNIMENDYIKIHDDLIRYFIDFFNWIEMYNPSKKELTKGFCYWGITIIKNDNLDKFKKIICSIINLFDNATSQIILTGNYIVSDNRYDKIKIEKEKLIEKFNGIKKLAERAINDGGYILHYGI